MKCSPRRLSAFQGFAAAPLFGAIALFVTLSGGAFAQGNDCAGLRAQITALDRSNARANPYAGTIRSQRAGLQRTQDYAHKIGCDRQQFIFFGSPPPPQCGQINAQIEQLRASLAQLEGSARGILDTPQRRQMVASYNAYCRQQTATQGGFLGGLFGGPDQQSNEPDIADVPPPDALPATDQPGSPRAVRKCSACAIATAPSSRSRDAPGRDGQTLSDFCKASCPNAEVSVYSRVPGQVIQTAVGLDGKPYMSLPAALKYQKSLDPACTCRAPAPRGARPWRCAKPC